MTVESGLKIVRQRFGVTQEEMAKALEMTRVTYISKERGRTEFSIEEFVRAAQFFENLIKSITQEAEGDGK